MGKIHKVKQGDSVTSLAEATGHFAGTIWKQPENDALRAKRGNMNILAEGDEVFVPDLCAGTHSGRTNLRHRFRRVGVPAIYRLQLLLDGEARKNLRYQLAFKGGVIDGFTDDRGVIEVFVPPSIEELQLFIGDEEWPRNLKIGDLEPADSVSGMQQRLRNLGFDCPASGTFDEATRSALRAFQLREGMNPTGDPDPDTLAILGRSHDEIGENQ